MNYTKPMFRFLSRTISLPEQSPPLIMAAVTMITVLVFLANPLLAHDNHHNSKQKAASEQHTQLHLPTKKKLSNPQPTPQHEASTEINSILQPGEFIFGLLIISPLGLWGLKRWIHKK